MHIDKLYHPEHLKQLAKNNKQAFKKRVQKIRQKKPKQLDLLIHGLHHEAFEKIDCLKCANCCRNLGPRILDKDIERLAKYLKIKPQAFIDEYLKIDEDKDYVFKSMPCPFLQDDNYCTVYEQRPKACRRYPHTDENKMIKILNLAVKNSETCPAVYHILDELKQVNLNEIK